MKKIKSILLFSFSLFFTFHFSFLAFYCFSQGVGINTTGSAAKDAAILEIGEGSDTQGLLIPRVNLTDVDVYLPLTGTSVTSLIVYSSTSPTNGNGPGYYYWSGSKWINIAAPSNGPGTSGQVLTSGGTGAATTWATPATYSAGTGLSLSLNTINSVWTTSGNDIYNNNSANVGIGATSQGAKLDVNGTAKVRTVLGVGADPWDIAGINVSNTGYGAFLTSGSDKQIGLGRQGSGVTWGIGQNTSGLLSIG
ncbi:MAG: hypothetical protein HGB12_04265, partial [Bacteroidetes bacterium]|nr:hypothetical protein [Bacteroidota bacterium]